MIAPLVSVIIPVYNRAEEVRVALRSALVQTLEDIEVIVVDDGSTDDLHDVLSEIPDKRLHVLKHATQHNAAAARNTGVKAARGRYVAFLDSDDEWLPEKLQRQVAALSTASPREKMCVTACLLNRGGGIWELRTPDLSPNLLTALVHGCTLNPGTAVMVEREAFLACGEFDVALTRLEDWDWLLRYAQRWEILVVPDPLAIVNVTDRADLDAVNRTLPLIWAHTSSRLNWHQRRQLRATLMIERGFINYLTGHWMQAGALVLAAAAVDPERVPEIARRVARRAWRGMRKAWGLSRSSNLDR
jgi:glycosyltransferase involved in cell wall biosynthesis